MFIKKQAYKVVVPIDGTWKSLYDYTLSEQGLSLEYSEEKETDPDHIIFVFDNKFDARETAKSFREGAAAVFLCEGYPSSVTKTQMRRTELYRNIGLHVSQLSRFMTCVRLLEKVSRRSLRRTL